MYKLKNFLGISKKSGNLIYGIDNVLYKSFKKSVNLVLTAKDISKNTAKKLKKHMINVETINLTKSEIEDIIGKYTAVLGILDSGMAIKILEILREEI